MILERDAFHAVDEIESSLHPRLIEYIIERFLKESEQAQLLLTTHYDGLLGEEDLLGKDNVWFTEKNPDGSQEKIQRTRQVIHIFGKGLTELFYLSSFI